MKLSKKKLFFFIFILLLISTSVFFFISQKSTSTFNPISDKSNFYTQLNLALQTGHLQTSSWDVRDFLNQVEFNLSDGNNTLKVIVSDQKNPISQIASLQELIKTAKIKNQSLKLVDLSAAHPYATFKNN